MRSLQIFLALCVLCCANPPLRAEKFGGASPALEKPAARTVGEEVALLAGGRLRAQKNALARLGAHPDPAADKVLRAQMERLRAGTLPPELWLELLEAAAKRPNPELHALLEARRHELEKSVDPLAAFAECLQGGDADEGHRIFTQKAEAGCIRCHSVEGRGGQIGPELTWLRHSVERIYILESLILPNASIAMGFQHAAFRLKNGKAFSGIVTFENHTDLTVTSIPDGKKRQLKAAQVKQRTPLPSPMPPHFGTALSKREIRDLIEFLAVGN